MSQFITLSSQDEKFKQYLWGTFSQTEKAIAIKSLNVNTQSETITFEILPKIKYPFFEKLNSTLKLQKLFMILIPIFILFFITTAQEELLFPVESLLATLGVVLLHYFALFRNDYKDYVDGIDRVSDETNNLILKGYYTAQELKNLALVCLGFAAFFGLPIILKIPEILFIFSFVAVFAALIYSGKGWGSKNKPMGEFFIFMTYGPLLALGYQHALVGGFNYEGMIVGFICGTINLILVHLRNFERILSYSKAQIKPTIVLLGFEKSKALLLLMWIGLALLFIGYSFYFDYQNHIYLGFSFFLASIFFTWRQLKKMNSCVGSDITKLKTMCEKFIFIFSIAWCLVTLLT